MWQLEAHLRGEMGDAAAHFQGEAERWKEECSLQVRVEARTTTAAPKVAACKYGHAHGQNQRDVDMGMDIVMGREHGYGVVGTESWGWVWARGQT